MWARGRERGGKENERMTLDPNDGKEKPGEEKVNFELNADPRPVGGVLEQGKRGAQRCVIGAGGGKERKAGVWGGCCRGEGGREARAGALGCCCRWVLTEFVPLGNLLLREGCNRRRCLPGLEKKKKIKGRKMNKRLNEGYQNINSNSNQSQGRRER